jgi:acyl dehydratase
VSATRTVTETHHIDAARVQAWAELSGDFNRLHVDPDFAATTPYGRCIAHGPLLASIVGELVAEQAGPAWASSSSLALRFVAPVFVPSEVTIEVELTDGSAQVTCTEQTGVIVLTAVARWQDQAG